MNKDNEAIWTALLADNASRGRQTQASIDAHESDSAAHTGVDELIDYVVIGYVVTTEEPSDWSTNWTDYYTKSGNIEDGYTYTAVADEAAPAWVADTYYSKGEVAETELTEEPDGTPYNFKSVYISTEFTDDEDTDVVFTRVLNGDTTLGLAYQEASLADGEGIQWFKVFLNRGYWEHRFCGAGSSGATSSIRSFWKYNHVYTEAEYETINKIQIFSALPGVVVKIYGVRADV